MPSERPAKEKHLKNGATKVKEAAGIQILPFTQARSSEADILHQDQT